MIDNNVKKKDQQYDHNGYIQITQLKTYFGFPASSMIMVYILYSMSNQ